MTTHPCFTHGPDVILPGCSWHELPELVLLDVQARSRFPAEVGHATAHLEWRQLHDENTHAPLPAAPPLPPAPPLLPPAPPPLPPHPPMQVNVQSPLEALLEQSELSLRAGASATFAYAIARYGQVPPWSYEVGMQ